ncbi:MAG: hypothetical protein AMS16_05625, partial [Planctomycetes bacterium DG_58]
MSEPRWRNDFPRTILRGAVFAAALLFAALGATGTFGASITLTDIDSGLTSPAGDYRWLNVADQVYGTTYRTNYDYTTVLRGTLTADGLKPNFAYQLKLTGTPGIGDNEPIGLAGRWWKETWNDAASSWDNGGNLNDKDTGYPPNPNDLNYYDWRDIPDASSPTGKRYRFTAYLVLDYFITDDNGDASFGFETGSSYHVLWKTTQRSRETDDGPLKSATFDPDPSHPAYDDNHPEATVTMYGEWERLPMGNVHLAAGQYACQMMLTEESFHGSGGTYAGGWAAAMGAPIEFTIIPQGAALPGDFNADNIVDRDDLAIFLGAFETEDPGAPDMDGDNDCDRDDL